MPRDQQKLALDVTYDIFIKKGGFPHEIRKAVLERVGLTMLRVVHTSALTEFFMDHIKDIMKVVESKISKVNTSKYRSKTSKIWSAYSYHIP